MTVFQPATLLRVHICERDRFQGKPLLQCILRKCQEFHIAKATAVRAMEGYGAASEVHRTRPFAHNLPVVISIIDAPGKIDSLIAEIEPMLEAGVIATSRVEAILVNNQARTKRAS
jgi:PII-like signaling protein